MGHEDTLTWELFARCASGFEGVLAQELKELRMRRVRPLQGGVSFFGTQADAYRACLWSRVATRIQLVLCRASATSAERLYEDVAAFAWEDHVRQGATIAVEAHGTNENLRKTTFTALKVKDALCDRLRNVWGQRPDVDAKNPDFALNVAVHQHKATVYLNLSGTSLHRRGYREDGVQTEAPLKETLAAGMLLAAGWPALADKGGALVDPMCGSGTLAIEAALMAAHVAPGILRATWGFEGWAQHDATAWGNLVAEATQQVEEKRPQACVIAGDKDAHAVEIARANVRRANVSDIVRLHCDDATNLGRHLRGVTKRGSVPGLLVANPPYGQRLLSQTELPQVHAALAAAVDAVPAGWRVAIITPDEGIDTALGREPQRTIECHNGPLSVRVRIFELDSSARQEVSVTSLGGKQAKVTIADAHSSQFAARLRKVARERLRWARKEGVSCVRLYDADLPDYALSVDLFAGTRGTDDARFAVLEEYRRPASVDARRAARRLADARALVAATLDVPAGNVLVHAWEGKDARMPPRDAHLRRLPLTVREGTISFVIDLNGRPDTGLPLWQRGIRELVAAKAQGKRFANLCDPSLAAAVCAAAGGAARTIAVSPYPDRARSLEANLRANGFEAPRHAVTCEDMRTWVRQEQRARHTYDLILCVPPAWMPARNGQKGKTARERDWELQRDHAALLRNAAILLSQEGSLVFACREHGFAPDLHALTAAGLDVQDLSARVTPPDFARSRIPLTCLIISASRRADTSVTARHRRPPAGTR